MIIAKCGKVIVDLEKETVEMTGFTFDGEHPFMPGVEITWMILKKAIDIIDKELMGMP